MDDSGRVILPDKAVPVSLRGLWVERARLAVYAVDDAGLMDGTVDPDRLEGIPASAMRLVKEREVILKKGRFTVYRSASLNLDPLPPGYYIMEAVGGGARGRSAFLVTRFGLVAKASRSGALLFAADLLDGRARPGAEIRAVSPGGRGAFRVSRCYRCLRTSVHRRRVRENKGYRTLGRQPGDPESGK